MFCNVRYTSVAVSVQYQLDLERDDLLQSLLVRCPFHPNCVVFGLALRRFLDPSYSVGFVLLLHDHHGVDGRVFVSGVAARDPRLGELRHRRTSPDISHPGHA